MAASPDHDGRHAFICPHCERPATATPNGSAVWDGRDENGEPSNPPVEWSLVQCDLCSQVSVELREDYGRGFALDDPLLVYPASRRLSRDVPSGLRREWEEAGTCFKAKAYTACVVMVRRTLEGTCAEHGLTKGTLAARLKELEAQGIVDRTLSDWADALRAIGNMGAHYTETTVSRQDAEDALAFAEALLDHIYVLRRRFEEFKHRLQK